MEIPRTYLQKYDYDCGAGVWGIILVNKGYHVIDHGYLIRTLGTTIESGTPIDRLVDVFKRVTPFDTKVKVHSTFFDLQEEISRNRFCIVAYQNWENQPRIPVFEWGHYAVAHRVDNDSIYLLDPGESSGTYTFSKEEFMSRWIDVDDEKSYECWMMSVKLHK